MRARLICLLLLSSLLLGGCGKGYKGEIDSICSSSVHSGTSYVLLPYNKGVTADDLQFREYATYVARALISKGFRPAQGDSPADLAIFVGYGISDPQVTTRTRSVPVYGQTGYSSSTTHGTLNTYGNYGTYSGTTTYTPKYGVTGYKQKTTTKTNFTRYLFIDAYDLREYLRTKKEVQVWKMSVTSTGPTNDLRHAIPYLVAGSMDYLGTNTGQKVKFKIKEKDDAVLLIKGMPVQ